MCGGFRTWEAALALGDHLLSGQHPLEGRSVLELGAGTGFLSILSSKLGAKDVTATDGSDKIVDLLKHNINLNTAGGHQLTAQKLWFGSRDGLEERFFDLILGADITYDESVLAPLCSTLSRLLKTNRHARALIAATVRREQT